ncbi:lipopolysaccharide heptosyltransferase II [Thiomonas intermedia]|uniref:lipopolysaccharide heptosyltransferase II n=1 Tax=Thiomonas intermedia TaxID=926 RepID=UPI0009A4BFA3|nr:lipopolysaccharide heptosyltransferase II [Thiomonas intermedia]
MTRVLLIAPQWIGDAVMAQPLVALLARGGATITALGLPSVAPVLRAMPSVDEVIEAPFAHGRLDFNLRRQLAAQLRGRGFERAYVLGNNIKSRLVPWLARIPRRIGYLGEARGVLLTDRVDITDQRAIKAAEPMALSPVSCRMPQPAQALRADMREHYAALAQISAAQVLPEPVLSIASQQAEAARQRFGLPQRWIALCPGAEYGPAKQWPVDHYAALAGRAQQGGYGVAILGASRDGAIGAQIAAGAAGSVNLCGATRLEEAIALLADCSGAVSNDSGLMHVAAALGRPTLGLYGSTDPRHTPPAAHRSAALWLHLDCSPCFQRTCPLGHLHCLRQITPDAAWDELSRLMAAPSFTD